MALPTAQQVLESPAPPPESWQALAKRDDESARAHAAFVDYALMGPGRSLRKLCDRYRGQSADGPGVKPPTRRLNTLADWSADHEWQERLEAWETEQQRYDQARWDERRKAVREADWQAGEALRGLAADILEQTPQFLKTTRRLVKGAKGQPAREIVTLQIDVPSMIKALEVASKLQGTAAGIEPPAQQINVGGSVTVSAPTVLPKPSAAAIQAAQAALRAALEQQHAELETGDGDSTSGSDDDGGDTDDDGI